MASPDIYTEIERLNAIDSNYDRRRAIESMPSDERFTVQIVIDKIERFYGYIREDGFRDGRSVVGTMANGEQELKLVFPANMNDEIDDWNEGRTVTAHVSFHEFDSAYERYQMLVRGLAIPDEVTVDTLASDASPPPLEATSHDDPKETLDRESIAQTLEENERETNDRTTTDSQPTIESDHILENEKTDQEAPAVTTTEPSAHETGPAPKSKQESTSKPESEPEPKKATPQALEAPEQKPRDSAKLKSPPPSQLESTLDAVNVDSLNLPPPPVSSKTVAAPKKRTKDPNARKPRKSRKNKRRKGLKKNKSSKAAAITTAGSSHKTRPHSETNRPRSSTRRKTLTHKAATASKKKIFSTSLGTLMILVTAGVVIWVYSIFDQESRNPYRSYTAYSQHEEIFTSEPQDIIEPQAPNERDWAAIPTRGVWKRASLNTRTPDFTMDDISGNTYPSSIWMHPNEPAILISTRKVLHAYRFETPAGSIKDETPAGIRTEIKGISFSEDGTKVLLHQGGKPSSKLMVYSWPLNSNSKPIMETSNFTDASSIYLAPFNGFAFTRDISGKVTLHEFNLSAIGTSKTPFGLQASPPLNYPTLSTVPSRLITINEKHDQLVGYNSNSEPSWQSSINGIPFKMHSSTHQSNYIATINQDRQIRIYQTSFKRPYWAINGLVGSPSSLNMAPNGTHLAFSPNNHSNEIWVINFMTGEVITRLGDDKATKYDWFRFSPNSKFLYALASKNELHVWEIKN